MRRTFVVGAIVALCAGLSAFGQDPPAERKLTFNFRDASPDAVLQFVCRELKWTLVYATTGNKPPDGTITAWSDSQIGETKVVDFLNTALAKAKVQVFQYGGVLKVIGEDDAKKGTFNIDVGEDPTKVPINDTIRTWVMPLKNANVVDVKKELGNILDSEGVTSAINTYSNTVVMTGKSSSIYRIVRILKIIDVSAAEKLDVKMFKLKHADSQETARLLNEIFKREAVGGQQGGRNPFQEMMRSFMGGGGRGGGGDGGPTAKTLASEVMRITSDARTNSVIATTTVDNMSLIAKLVEDLDKEAAQAIRLKLYPLRYADARETAAVITSIFADEQTQTRQATRNQPRLPMFLGGVQQQQQDPTGASREVRAVADTRSNSVVIAANESNMKICDDLVANLDRQLTDVLRIKIYELKNADATAMTTVLRDIFRVQVTATQNAGRTQGGGGGGGQNNPFMQMFGQGGRGGNTAAAGGLPPAQEVEITADARTNSVVVKASDEYIAIMDQVVTQLDQNPTEQYSTYVLPLSNANASDLAGTLQSLLRGTGGGGNQNRNQQGSGLPGIGNQGTRNTGARTGSTQGGTQGGARTGGGTRNLGPLEGQDEPAPPMPSPQDDEEARRGVQGQVDVQADPQTNSLVIRTSPRNFESIRNIVQGLDRMRPQVLIKVLIAEVTLDDEFRFGVEWNWENKFHVNGDSITQAYKTDYNLFSQGGTATLTGDELGATLNAFAEDGRLKVMATPRILVLDNQSAEISIGKDVPRVTNSTINAQGNPQNTIQYRTVGILLSVTPHINFDGLVTMQVHPEISDRAPESESVQITEGVTSPTFNVNYADTVVAARNGQTVVIGGLIRESEEDTVQKIPFLGDIPIIGALFSNTTKAKVRRELMIFLTPYVAFTSGQLEEIAELEKAKLKLLDWRDVEDEGDRWLKKLKR